ncbi:hypothetical protein RRG08_034305 [Elysia crispata]|uniref:Uncharacterized protein n=1 Tax=Elysia crispata TaxID=231223 RepID=A0AAE1AIX9_9GAST|nr:hypothetical protein RRG08_034305 [Elysia crispata]
MVVSQARSTADNRVTKYTMATRGLKMCLFLQRSDQSHQGRTEHLNTDRTAPQPDGQHSTNFTNSLKSALEVIQKDDVGNTCEMRVGRIETRAGLDSNPQALNH